MGVAFGQFETVMGMSRDMGRGAVVRSYVDLFASGKEVIWEFERTVNVQRKSRDSGSGLAAAGCLTQRGVSSMPSVLAAGGVLGVLLLAYTGAPYLPLLLCGVLLLAAFLPGSGTLRLCLLDWFVLLVLTYEIPSLAMSQYSANGLRAAMTALLASLLYFCVRLAVRRSGQVFLIAALVGVGGAILACLAWIQFHDHVLRLRANGFWEIVAFRARLIDPPAPWILGEWLTLVLLTLPFAAAVPVYLWLGRRRTLAVIAAPIPVVICAGLLLSCSRAVFWGLIVFTVAAVAAAAVYRVIPIRPALIALVGALCILGLVLAGEEALYPGVMEAYTGRHTSQVRSAEGRLAIWKRSAEVFRVSPLWGVGAGNAPLFLASNANQDETTGFASRTFSLPVQLLTEKGAIGVAL